MAKTIGIDLGTTRMKVGLISTEGEPLGFGRAEHSTDVNPAQGSAEQDPDAWWAGLADWFIPRTQRILRDRLPLGP